MDRKRIRKAAEELIGFGYTRQHAFDELVSRHPEVRPKRIAGVVRFIPSLAARERYRKVHQALLLAIVLYAGMQLARAFNEGRFETSQWKALSVFPIATVFLGISVYRHRGEAYQAIAFLNLWVGFGFLRTLSAMRQGGPDPWTAAQQLAAIALCALAWYLHARMVPKYTEEKAPNGTGPSRFVFPPEPGVTMM